MSDVGEVLSAYSGDAVPGVALAVLQGGRQVFGWCAGVADASTGARITRATNFRLASVSKQFTAALILGLVNDDALRLDARVRAILPELPACADDIRIGQLLQHTSGLPDHEDLVSEKQRDPIDDADVVALLRQSSLLYFPPGTGFRYSNTGYVLLGVVAARVAQAPLPRIFAERLFRPLGLERTVALVAGTNVVEHRAYGHTLTGGVFRSTDQGVMGATLGDGGIYSSVEDLARWCRAWDEARVPGWPTVVRALDPRPRPAACGPPYGMGWEIRCWNGRRVHSHAGSTTGFRTCIARFPDDGLSVVVLTNRSNSIPAGLMAGLLRQHLPDWKSSPGSFLLCQQIVGQRPLDRHARPHLENGHAP